MAEYCAGLCPVIFFKVKIKRLTKAEMKMLARKINPRLKNKTKQAIAAVLVVVFLFYNVAPAYARPGNYGDANSFEQTLSGAWSGLTASSSSSWGDYLTNLAVTTAVDLVDLWYYTNYYNEYGKTLISFEIGGTTVDISRGQMVRMVASVAASTVSGVATGKGVSLGSVINSVQKEFVTLLMQEIIRDILVRKCGLSSVMAGLISSIAIKFISDNWGDSVFLFLSRLGTLIDEYIDGDNPYMQQKATAAAMRGFYKKVGLVRGGEKEEAGAKSVSTTKGEIKAGINLLKSSNDRARKQISQLNKERWHRPLSKEAKIRELQNGIDNNDRAIAGLEDIYDQLTENSNVPVPVVLDAMSRGVINQVKANNAGDPLGRAIKGGVNKAFFGVVDTVAPGTSKEIEAEEAAKRGEPRKVESVYQIQQENEKARAKELGMPNYNPNDPDQRRQLERLDAVDRAGKLGMPAYNHDDPKDRARLEEREAGDKAAKLGMPAYKHNNPNDRAELARRSEERSAQLAKELGMPAYNPKNPRHNIELQKRLDDRNKREQARVDKLNRELARQLGVVGSESIPSEKLLPAIAERLGLPKDSSVDSINAEINRRNRRPREAGPGTATKPTFRLVSPEEKKRLEDLSDTIKKAFVDAERKTGKRPLSVEYIDPVTGRKMTAVPDPAGRKDPEDRYRLKPAEILPGDDIPLTGEDGKPVIFKAEGRNTDGSLNVKDPGTGRPYKLTDQGGGKYKVEPAGVYPGDKLNLKTTNSADGKTVNVPVEVTEVDDKNKVLNVADYKNGRFYSIDTKSGKVTERPPTVEEGSDINARKLDRDTQKIPARTIDAPKPLSAPVEAAPTSSSETSENLKDLENLSFEPKPASPVPAGGQSRENVNDAIRDTLFDRGPGADTPMMPNNSTMTPGIDSQGSGYQGSNNNLRELFSIADIKPSNIVIINDLGEWKDRVKEAFRTVNTARAYYDPKNGKIYAYGNFFRESTKAHELIHRIVDRNDSKRAMTSDSAEVTISPMSQDYNRIKSAMPSAEQNKLDGLLERLDSTYFRRPSENIRRLMANTFDSRVEVFNPESGGRKTLSSYYGERNQKYSEVFAWVYTLASYPEDSTGEVKNATTPTEQAYLNSGNTGTRAAIKEFIRDLSPQGIAAFQRYYTETINVPSPDFRRAQEVFRRENP
jgi:hypothetical protein